MTKLKLTKLLFSKQRIFFSEHRISIFSRTQNKVVLISRTHNNDPKTIIPIHGAQTKLRN